MNVTDGKEYANDDKDEVQYNKDYVDFTANKGNQITPSKEQSPDRKTRKSSVAFSSHDKYISRQSITEMPMFKLPKSDKV